MWRSYRLGSRFASASGVVASHAYETARGHYLEAKQADAAAAARHVQGSLKEIYENLRTLAQLPSVRNIDRHGANLGSDGRETIQQIYNNLANTSPSPKSISFLRISILTKWTRSPARLEEPILMFDQLIVHAGRFAAADDPFAKKDDDKLGRRQRAPRSRNFRIPSASRSVRLAEAALSQFEFDPRPGFSDDQRAGDHHLRQYAATSRPWSTRIGPAFCSLFRSLGPTTSSRGASPRSSSSSAIRKWLPEQNFALVNAGVSLCVSAKRDGAGENFGGWVAQGRGRSRVDLFRTWCRSPSTIRRAVEIVGGRAGRVLRARRRSARGALLRNRRLWRRRRADAGGAGVLGPRAAQHQPRPLRQVRAGKTGGRTHCRNPPRRDA